MCSLRSRYASLLAALAILTGVVLIGAVDTLLDPRGSDRWSRMSERIITAVSRTMLGNIAISRARMEALRPTGDPPGPLPEVG